MILIEINQLASVLDDETLDSSLISNSTKNNRWIFVFEEIPNFFGTLNKFSSIHQQFRVEFNDFGEDLRNFLENYATFVRWIWFLDWIVLISFRLWRWTRIYMNTKNVSVEFVKSKIKKLKWMNENQLDSLLNSRSVFWIVFFLSFWVQMNFKSVIGNKRTVSIKIEMRIFIFQINSIADSFQMWWFFFEDRSVF